MWLVTFVGLLAPEFEGRMILLKAENYIPNNKALDIRKLKFSLDL
jgi:hypothetical protein